MDPEIKITDILQEACILLPLNARDRTDAITQLVDVLAAADSFTDRDKVLEAVLAREKIRSTGVGDGLAVPHGKSHACRRLVMAVGVADPPVDFPIRENPPPGSSDPPKEVPCRCTFIVLLGSPMDERGPHIRALARITRLWQIEPFREAVARAESAADLYAAIDRYQE